MVQRYPTAQPFENSDARLMLRLRLGRRRIQIEAGSLTVLVCAALGAVLAAAYLATACYFIFRDDLLARMLSSQAETQYAYEDRIAALRAHLDRVATRQLINQDSFEEKVNELISRQSQLETRQAIVNTIVSEAESQAMLPAAGRRAATTSLRKQDAALARPDGPTPLPGEPVGDAAPRKSSLLLSPPELRLGAHQAVASVTPSALAEVAAGLDRIQNGQMAALQHLEHRAEKRLGRIDALIAEVGLGRSRFAPSTSDGVGGPLIAAGAGAAATPFEKSVLKLETALGRAAQLNTALTVLPINRPITGDLVVTSGFGLRPDPFLHASAMHTGLDLRGAWGSPVHATAPGKVIAAGNQGGYGNMVEIDHGYGLTTRYAHLSSIDVEVGDTLKKGDLVGEIGSTGRSTGPHLHYETRIDGEPVDPMRFLTALDRVGTL